MQSMTGRGALEKLVKSAVSLGAGVGILFGTGGCDTPNYNQPRSAQKMSDARESDNYGTMFDGLGLLGAISGSISPLGQVGLGIAGNSMHREAQLKSQEAVITGQQEAADRIVNGLGGGQQGNYQTERQYYPARQVQNGNVRVVHNAQLGEVHVNDKLDIFYGRGFFAYQGSNPGYTFGVVCKEQHDFNGDGNIYFPDEFVGINDTWNEDESFMVCIGTKYMMNGARIEIVDRSTRQVVHANGTSERCWGWIENFAPDKFKNGFYRFDFFNNANSTKPIGHVNFCVRGKNE